MRVISGFLKGRRLERFNHSGIRPTTDREKEMIFNWIGSSIEGAAVLDLFGGTGALSIESISRGAGTVTCIEHNSHALTIIRKNFRALEIGQKISLFRKDAFRFLPFYKGEGFDLIFIDPPFTKQLAHEVLEKVAISQVLKAGTQVVLEATTHEWKGCFPKVFDLKKEKTLGDKKVFLFEAQLEGVDIEEDGAISRKL